jgi:hypothetical protein
MIECYCQTRLDRMSIGQYDSFNVTGKCMPGEWAPPRVASADSVVDPYIASLALTCCGHFVHLDPIHHTIYPLDPIHQVLTTSTASTIPRATAPRLTASKT